MKNQTAKRLFAFLMVLMLVATALPVQALAAEEHVHQESTEALLEAPAVQVEEPATAPTLEDILGAFADVADAYALTPEMTEKQLRAVRGSFPSEEAVAACAAQIENIALQAELLTAEEQEALIADETVQLIDPSGQRETAIALDIDEDFGLVVRTEDGQEKTVRSGEVSVRGLYGYV